MTFDARTLSPMRKPARKTVIASSSQTGHTTAPRGGQSELPTQMQRASAQASGGYASGIAAKMWPWSKNHNDTESETSASRSTLRSPSGRRQSTSPRRNSAQNVSHNH